MKIEWKRDEKTGCTENPGVVDTGNGALKTIEVSDQAPGILRITVESYCGRSSDNERYYRSADGRCHKTLAAALRATIGAN